jgi:hypothetical protein
MKLVEHHFPSGTKNSKFKHWVVWVELGSHHPAIIPYRTFWTEYIPKKRKLHSDMYEWVLINQISTPKRIEKIPELNGVAFGFETAGEAMQFLLVFSDRILEIELK